MTHRTRNDGACTRAEGDCLLPAAYRLLPVSVPFYVPGFLKLDQGSDFVLVPEPTDCGTWFERFADRVAEAVGTAYLPVCRMSDGEFLMLFGYQAPSLRLGPARRLRIRLRQAAEVVRRRIRGFRAYTADGVSSGALSARELRASRPELSKQYAAIAREGILAPHLSYGLHPFQEQYFPALGRWLEEQSVTLTLENYVTFYFVYGLLRGPRFPSLIDGRRVLVVHSATGDKREAITRTLRESNPRGIEWMTISPTRSFAEVIDLTRLQEKPDICLLGAGVGKAQLFPQLKPLGIPCLDAGYSFEVWADPDKQWDRTFMTPDATYESSRRRF